MSEPHGESVLVTGAAGTVGHFVVSRLLDAGYRVIAVDRPASLYPRPKEGQVMTVRSGDLGDPDFCEEAMEGASRVIHAAEIVDPSLSYEELAKVNVHSVRHLYEAARRHQVKVFVHISSATVYKAPPTGIKAGLRAALRGEETELDEMDDLEPLSAYERTKIESEQILEELARSPGPAYVILRLGVMYGPGGRFLGGMLSALPSFVWLLAGGRMLGLKGGPRTNWVHAEDAARAAIFTMENDKTWNQVYNVADDTPLSFGDVATAAIRAYGRPLDGHLFIPPKWAIKTLFPLVDTDLFLKTLNVPVVLLWALIRRRYGIRDDLQVQLDRSTLAYAGVNMTFSNERLKSMGFSLKWPDVRLGVQPVIRWYQEKGWIPTVEQLEQWPELGLGIRFRLRMSGEHMLSSNGDMRRPGTLELVVTLPSLLNITAWDHLDAEGSCHLEGLADHVSCQGRLEITFHRADLFYNLRFQSNDQEPLHLQGSTRWEHGRPVDSLSSMSAMIYDESGKERTRATFKMDLPSEVLSVLSSLRLQI